MGADLAEQMKYLANGDKFVRGGPDESYKILKKHCAAAPRAILSIFHIFVPAKVLHERFVQYLFSIVLFLLDTPVCGPALLQVLPHRGAMVQFFQRCFAKLRQHPSARCE